MTTDESPALILPDDFDDDEWEVEAKGALRDVEIRRGGRAARVTFYDPVRLSQDIESQIRAGRAFAVERLIVVNRVNRSQMESAIVNLGDELIRDIVRPDPSSGESKWIT